LWAAIHVYNDSQYLYEHFDWICTRLFQTLQEEEVLLFLDKDEDKEIFQVCLGKSFWEGKHEAYQSHKSKEIELINCEV